mmetsp:Transcript_60278/g.194106  ORF Transcript_60278/g.194106 Transcript_60278/m.194106 type:complete len:203 (+) Transcript_60278:216-824(+)
MRLNLPMRTSRKEMIGKLSFFLAPDILISSSSFPSFLSASSPNCRGSRPSTAAKKEPPRMVCVSPQGVALQWATRGASSTPSARHFLLKTASLSSAWHRGSGCSVSLNGKATRYSVTSGTASSASSRPHRWPWAMMAPLTEKSGNARAMAPMYRRTWPSFLGEASPRFTSTTSSSLHCSCIAMRSIVPVAQHMLSKPSPISL